jgi:hypothetical protein
VSSPRQEIRKVRRCTADRLAGLRAPRRRAVAWISLDRQGSGQPCPPAGAARAHDRTELPLRPRRQLRQLARAGDRVRRRDPPPEPAGSSRCSRACCSRRWSAGTWGHTRGGRCCQDQARAVGDRPAGLSTPKGWLGRAIAKNVPHEPVWRSRGTFPLHQDGNVPRDGSVEPSGTFLDVPRLGGDRASRPQRRYTAKKSRSSGVRYLVTGRVMPGSRAVGLPAPGAAYMLNVTQ